MHKTLWVLACTCLSFYAPAQKKIIGAIERIDPELNSIIKKDAVVEVIGEGFDWTEGPLWVEKYRMLLFSDIPRNSIYKWTEKKGVELYLNPSGYTGAVPRGGETGSNALRLTADGRLLLCQHGNRQVAIMDAPLNHPKPVFIPVADNYKGKKFNSPNDAVIRSNGDVFFTDPPYGLEKGMEDPLKEIPFQGVYKADKNGKLTLLTDSITRPNGIGLTADEKTLVIGNTDGKKLVWYAFDLGANDSLVNGRIFCDARGQKENGGPDGFKFTRKGYLFASAPGGIWILNPHGKLIGKMKIPAATSNCALSQDEKTLYITADMYVLRVKMR